MPYNVYAAATAGPGAGDTCGPPRLAGVQFTISGVPSGGIRAEFPGIVDAPTEAHIRSQDPVAISVPSDGTYTVLFNRLGPTQLSLS
jgi:hypothetical protein